jgi:hypothetical protein
VRAHLAREARQLDEVVRLDRGGVAAGLDAFRAQPRGLHELAHEARLGQARAIRAEGRQGRRERRQRARPRRTRAGMIDEGAHHRCHRRPGGRA